MSQRPQNSKVTVEDLLRLKRAERPNAEFWNKFEVELRQKQLAALVERRPWWQQIPLLVNRRAYLPIGATAVLTFTLVSLRYYAPTHVASLAPTESATPATIASRVTEPRHDIVASVEANQPRVEQVLAEEAPPAAAQLQLSDQLPAKTDELIPWSAPRAEQTPSARSIAANLAKLAETDPDLANAALPGSRNTASSEVQETATRAAELAGVAAISSRRNRLLAAMTDRQFTPDPAAPEVVRERLARRLGDTELSGGWTRVGLKADRVSLKF